MNIVFAGALFAAGCTSTPPPANPPARTAPPSSAAPAVASPAAASPAAVAAGTGAPVAADEAAIYKSNGQVPPAPQLNAMLEDSLMRWNAAMQKGDFKPFVAWQAKAAQQYMKPEEDAKASAPLVENKVDYTEFKGVEPKVIVPATLQDSPFGGKMISTTVEYTKDKDKLQVAVKYIDDNGLWRVGEFKSEFDRQSGDASPAAKSPAGQ